MLTEKQREEFEVLYDADSSLTEDEYLDLKTKHFLYVSYFEKKSRENAMESLSKARARKHRLENLEMFETISGNKRWRCYSSAKNKYRRKDGKPLTDEDIESIQLYRRGQGHGVHVEEDRSFLTHSWWCDSSD